MKTISRLRYFLYLSILIVSCTTGKNALQKGNYDQSVFKSVDRLKSSPKNAEAIYVLPIAYDLALKDHLRKIEEEKISSDLLKWESILAHYQKINQLSDEVNSSPVALSIIKSPQKFINEVEDSKFKAAEVRYTLGVKKMNENNRVSAKRAYYDFEKAQYFYPNYKDVQNKLDEAYWAAVVKVMVQPAQVNSSYYQLSNQYFQDQVSEFMSNYQSNRFVVFYSEQQAKAKEITPNHILRMSFDDFVVGQTYVKERVEKLKRDSVLIGESRGREKVYGTVTATLSTFNKQVSSSGLLRMTIYDQQQHKTINQQRFPGTYIWEDSWASYKGDERALNSQQLQMTRRREMMPPTPATLFVEFTKPIYVQLVEEISNFYNKY